MDAFEILVKEEFNINLNKCFTMNAEYGRQINLNPALKDSPYGVLHLVKFKITDVRSNDELIDVDELREILSSGLDDDDQIGFVIELQDKKRVINMLSKSIVDTYMPDVLFLYIKELEFLKPCITHGLLKYL